MKQRIFSQCREALSACKPQVLQYLENKYGESFTWVGARGECWGMPADRYLVKTPGAGEDGIFAVFGRYSRGVCAFADAYYSVLIHPEYERFIHRIAGEFLPRFALRLTLNRESPNPAGLVKGVPVTDIYRHIQPGGPSFSARITLFAPKSALSGIQPSGPLTASEGLRRIAAQVAEAKLLAWLKLYVLTDESFENGIIMDGFSGTPVTCYTGMDYHAQLWPVKQIGETPETQAVFASKDALPEAGKPETAVLDDWQLERLCSLVYLDGILSYQDEETLGEIVDYMLAYGMEDCKIDGRLPCEMTEIEWRRVLLDIRADALLAALYIIKSEDVTEADTQISGTLPGHRAVCFFDGNGSAYAVFRGTCGDDEWYDNALGMVQADTPQQQAAARFVEELRNDGRIKRIITAGHSKGGNKAQYAAITTPKGYVERCLALDGQGFSPAFMDKYAEAIAQRKSNIHLIAERRDFVNCLGLYLTDGTRFYIGRRGDPSPGAPHGAPLSYFHCPDALRDTVNRVGQECRTKPISDTFNQWVTYFLTEPRYESQREDTAVDLIALLMKNKRASVEETAEALVNLIVVFMDLVCENHSFRDHVVSVFLQETEVLLATFGAEAARNGSQPLIAEAQADGGLAKYTAECLAWRIIAEPPVRKHFICTLKHLVLLIKQILTTPGMDDQSSDWFQKNNNGSQSDDQILDHIFTFIESLLKRLTGTVTYKALYLILAGWRSLSGRTRMRYKMENLTSAPADTEEADTDFGLLLAYLDGWLDNPYTN